MASSPLWHDPKDDDQAQVNQATIFGVPAAVAAAATAALKAGNSARDIYKRTGLWQHGDGTWRREQFGPMSVAPESQNVSMDSSFGERYHPANYVGTLPDLLHAPHIYANAPQVANTEAYQSDAPGLNFGGQVPPRGSGPGAIWLNDRTGSEPRLNIAAHEAYHNIDHYAGHPAGGNIPEATAPDLTEYQRYANTTHEVGARLSASRDMAWQALADRYGPDRATAAMRAAYPPDDEDVPRSQQFAVPNKGNAYPALELSAKNMAPDANGAYPHKTAYAAALRANGWKGADKAVPDLFKNNAGVLPPEYGGPSPQPVSDSGKPVYRVPMGRQEVPANPIWHDPASAPAGPQGSPEPVSNAAGNGASGAWSRMKPQAPAPAPEPPPALPPSEGASGMWARQKPQPPAPEPAPRPVLPPSEGHSGLWGSYGTPKVPDSPAPLPTSPSGPSVTSSALQGGPWAEATHGTYVPTQPAAPAEEPMVPRPDKPYAGGPLEMADKAYFQQMLLPREGETREQFMDRMGGDVAGWAANRATNGLASLVIPDNKTPDTAEETEPLRAAEKAKRDANPDSIKPFLDQLPPTQFGPAVPGPATGIGSWFSKPAPAVDNHINDPVTLPTAHGNALSQVLAATRDHPGQALASGDTQTGGTPAYDDKFAPDSPGNNNVATPPSGAPMDPTGNPYAPGGMNSTYQLGAYQPSSQSPWGGATAAPPPPQYTGQAAPQAHQGGGGGMNRPQAAPPGAAGMTAPPAQPQPNMGPGTPFGGSGGQPQKPQFGGQGGQQGQQQNPISNLISGIVSLPLNVVQGITKGLGNYVSAMNQNPPTGYTNTPSQIQQASTNISQGQPAFPFGGSGGSMPTNQSMANYQNTQPQATGWGNWNAGPGGY